MSRLSVSLLALALASCGRLGFDRSEGAAGSGDGGAGDAGGADADALACGAAPDDGTLALIPFDPDEGTMALTDVAGAHDGTIEGIAAFWTDGPEGCGRAIRFPAVEGDDTYGLLPDSPDWDLAEGALDFWFRFEDAPSNRAAVLSRDADGDNMPGHLTVSIVSDGSVLVRLQRPGSVFFCSEPLQTGIWHHFGLNLGPPQAEMYLDGELSDLTGPHPVTGDPCGDVTVGGIDGNDNPWGIGAATTRSAEGSAEPTIDFFYGGAVDHLRISSVRREFSR